VYVTLSPIEGISTTRHGLIVGGVGVDDTLGHGDVGMGDLDGHGIDDLLIGSDWAADYDGRVWWYPSGG
jgi:alpha-acetolactate decarboxylase